MGKSLRVYDGSSWNTVGSPHILHGGTWERSFKVHVINGGVWKESHKTPYTQYSIGGGGYALAQDDDTWTVPAKTRYIRVKIWGHGGSAGGGMATTKFNPTGGGSTVQERAVGGSGGHGAYAEVILETKPGVVFSWTGFSSTPYLTAGRGTDSLRIAGITAHQYNSINGAKFPDVPLSSSFGEWQPHASAYENAYSAFWGEHGNDAPDIVFTGDSIVSGDPYVLTAGGGKKGYGGTVWVTAGSKSGSTHYYTMSQNHGHAMSAGGCAADCYGSGISNPVSHDTVSGYDFSNTNQTSVGWPDGRGTMNAGSATLTGNGSSFVSSTLTRGAGSEGGWYGNNVISGGIYIGTDGNVGTKGKLIIDTYQ